MQFYGGNSSASLVFEVGARTKNAATVEKAHAMIAELESMIESGTAPSEGKVKKLNDLL